MNMLQAEQSPGSQLVNRVNEGRLSEDESNRDILVRYIGIFDPYTFAAVSAASRHFTEYLMDNPIKFEVSAESHKGDAEVNKSVLLRHYLSLSNEVPTASEPKLTAVSLTFSWVDPQSYQTVSPQEIYSSSLEQIEKDLDFAYHIFLSINTINSGGVYPGELQRRVDDIAKKSRSFEQHKRLAKQKRKNREGRNPT
jgi:hypothetical protein